MTEKLRAATFNAQLAFLETLMGKNPQRAFLADRLQRIANTMKDSTVSANDLHGNRKAMASMLEEVVTELSIRNHPVENHMILSIAESVKTAQYHQKNCIVPRHLQEKKS